MNKRLKSTAPHAGLTLGDFILAVSSSTRSRRERAAAVTDLLRSGRVCLADRRCKLFVAA